MKPPALVLAGALLLAGCRQVPESPERPVSYLGALRLPSVGPHPYDWRQLGGRVVLVAFVATWSFPSIAWMPTLTALQKEYGPRGFQVVVVGLDQQGAQVLEPFAEHFATTLPVLLSDAAMQGGTSVFGPFKGVPATFLLDKQGAVAGGWQGMASHQAVAEAVETLLQR